MGRALAARSTSARTIDDPTPELLRGDPAAFKERIQSEIAERREQQEGITIPRTRSEADREARTSSDVPSPSLEGYASSVRLQHPHVATALQQLSASQQMDTQRLVSALKSQSGQFNGNRDTEAALNNLEQAPLTAKLFERGLLSAQNVANAQYVNAMEKSLRLRQERTGVIKNSSARRSSQPQYMRTIPRPGGAYQYRRPHFDTSPMFVNAG
jgi:predicted DNA-binding ribbon-helix-helix protein